MSETHEYVRCDKCLGVKEYMGMGLIMRDCHVCDKVGYVKRPLDDIAILAAKQLTKSQEKHIEAQEDVLHGTIEEEIIVQAKKRGRKPKVT